MVSGREFHEPIAVGPVTPLTWHAPLADTGYYSGLNVRASGAMYHIRLPIKVVANVKDGVVDAIWGVAVWSRSSRKVRLFLSTTGERWGIFDSIMVLQSFGGKACPP